MEVVVYSLLLEVNLLDFHFMTVQVQLWYVALIWLWNMSGIFEEGFNSIKDLTKPLESKIDEYEMNPPTNYHFILRLGHLIRDIDRVKPISPLGLFSLDRTILTGSISVAITYIIVLIQFRLSFEQK